MPRIPSLLERIAPSALQDLLEAQRVSVTEPGEFSGIKHFLCDCSLEEIMNLGCQCGGH